MDALHAWQPHAQPGHCGKEDILDALHQRRQQAPSPSAVSSVGACFWTTSTTAYIHNVFRLQWRHWALECVKTLYDDIGSAFVVFVAQVQRLCPDHPGKGLWVWRRRQRRHALLNACFAL